VRHLRDHAIVVTLISLVIPAVAGASVSLAFVDQDGTNNGSVNVAAGGSFIVRLNLVATNATTDRVAGIDYYLAMLGSGSGLFRIQDRNTVLNPNSNPPTESPYNDEHFTDPEVEALQSALLDPQNNDNLGATKDGGPTLNGTFFVAFYTIAVDPSTPAASYSLQTTSDPGLGWSDPDFNDFEFAQHANYTIVVPEPTGLAACGALCLILGRRRMRA
jgi:hypothetical protein